MVGACLSRNEFIAVAIKYKAMDEAIYKEWPGICGNVETSEKTR